MKADLNPSAYDAFAPFYDAFTATSDYETFGAEVLRVAGGFGLTGNRLLDLACGTGNSFEPFLQRGYRVTGCDISPGMLGAAAAKWPEARLVRGDVRELPVLGSFDLVTCFDDSLNYLAGEAELAAAFAGMARNLSAGGIAAFDLNSLCAYRTTFASDSVREDDGILFAWRGLGASDAAPGCVSEAQIDVFHSAAGGAWERVTTRHRQRHFERDAVLELLAGSGLDCLAVHGVQADASLDDTADEERHLKVLYIARRAEGGDF